MAERILKIQNRMKGGSCNEEEEEEDLEQENNTPIRFSVIKCPNCSKSLQQKEINEHECVNISSNKNKAKIQFDPEDENFKNLENNIALIIERFVGQGNGELNCFPGDRATILKIDQSGWW